MYTSLLYASKYIASEARAVFFAGNRFAFTISIRPHTPIYFKSPRIFGPLGLPHRLHLLRDLRHINLLVDIDDRASHSRPSPHAVVRHRARLEHFVEILRKHAEDSSKKSLLKSLHMRLSTTGLEYQRLVTGRLIQPSDETKRRLVGHHVFALEGLVAFEGIDEEEVTGLPKWFCRCLEPHMVDRGGQVEELIWPVKIVKKRHDNGYRVQKVEISTRKYWQPTLNWREFSRRDSIELPEDIDEYFSARQGGLL
ncbi:uncharacterized protein M421DRAFT_216636 [Didymella exigua CBS 183.55]|uniref:Uncharacterized protein n=1 Tax=Didymella exigua CBS 183.55 TaxID=1150837 RepID=A0A6A5RDV0_9PLEO|nr:uncharacterized protein M421DRAFT_216636 [Didymella exigua CBS 183.55]KAF1926445.1 hypothetical protein M421DRAFT_216636 [Didymella exigua CBS 183.55]